MKPRPRARRACAFLLATVPLLSPHAAAAQSGRFVAPAWVGEATFLSLDALTGAVTAGVIQRLRGGSFRDGFTRGALGGAVSYGGRRLAAARFSGAGFLGREVSAVGASVTRNAADARPALDRVLLPIGPVHLYLDRSGSRLVSAKLNLSAVAVALWAATRPELEFDLRGSLSAGTAAFVAPGRRIRAPGYGEVEGMVAAGTILLSGVTTVPGNRVFAHERVHVLQDDFLFYTLDDEIEGWVADRTRWGRWLYRYADASSATDGLIGWLYVAAGVPHASRPREIEAGFLENR